jgi:hypothetical protein
LAAPCACGARVASTSVASKAISQRVRIAGARWIRVEHGGR